MTDGAIPRSIRPLLDVVRIGIPVVRHGIEVLLLDPHFLEGVPHSGYQSQGSDFLGIPRILTQEQPRTGGCPFPHMATGTVPIRSRGVAGGTAYPPHVIPVHAYRPLRSLFRVMTLDTCRPYFYLAPAGVHLSIPVQLRARVAIGAEHPLLVVHIRHPTVLTGKLWVYSTAMTEGTGFRFVLADELMPIYQS